MKSFLSVAFLLTVLPNAVIAVEADPPEPYAFRYPIGSPTRCPVEVNRLGALPGYGWDNLRHEEMAYVVEPLYTKCRLTNDRKFLIPDRLQVHEKKSSDTSAYSAMFDHISNYTNPTARSITFDAKLDFGKTSNIGGSYSEEYKTTKMKMVQNKAVTTRAQYRYVYYKVQYAPESPLASDFKKRLYYMAFFVENDHRKTVQYQADLLVRDYGTHYVRQHDVGGALVKEDQIKTTFVQQHSGNIQELTHAASAIFSLVLNFTLQHTTRVEEELKQQYQSEIKSSELYCYGGPPVGSYYEFSLSKWLSALDNNLVTIDRFGDPLWFVITPLALPELPFETVHSLADAVRAAVLRYYEYNTHRGCTSIDAPNFSLSANLDDGTCHQPKKKYTFGGVYQTCTGPHCSSSFMLRNPKTGDFSCPKDYEALMVYGRLEQRETHTYSSGCDQFLFFYYNCRSHRSHTVHRTTYNAYWCVDIGNAQQNTGYMFGGAYSDHSMNPVTQSRSCPKHFYALTFGKDIRMSVCVSDAFDHGFRHSLPFAGFFTCNFGNPLVLSVEKLLNQTGHAGAPSLGGHVYKTGPQDWPKRCPDGYSQHLLAITELTCQVSYCAQSGAVRTHGLPNIQLPPFSPRPRDHTNTTRQATSYANMFDVPPSTAHTERLTQTTQRLPQTFKVVHSRPISGAYRVIPYNITFSRISVLFATWPLVLMIMWQQ